MNYVPDYIFLGALNYTNFFFRWGADEYVEKNVITLMDTTYIHREPLGVCLVMGAWNYPVQLTLQPVTGAIASGNCVVIKPSEVASSTALVMEKLITKYVLSSPTKHSSLVDYLI